MKFIVLCGVGITFLLGIFSCGGRHLIADATERAAVRQDFEKRRETLPQGDLFGVFDKSMSDEQRESMTFLYAYMPLADIVDHPGEFYLENVNCALRARAEMPWGKAVPEREFRHFVLPVRVNNEDLDDCRKVFYEELKDRVKNLSLYDAVLEVNHWCHEKVSYTPSDARTSSPLASVRTAYGRCGEESTFTVAALRSVGIPARQVYTPRWAHTDDNHAWVEAWVDGKWYFLGACEPEPVLDLGWFNAPASRGMLMHTKVFGRYNGPEEVMLRTPRYTEINVIDNYAPTARTEVTVIDAEGNPVADARVEFKVYNYAEFYTVAAKQTDAGGKTFLTAGKGDMLVWASKDGKFGYAKLSFGKQEALTVRLDKTAGGSCVVAMDIVPPAESANMPDVTSEQRAENNRRTAREDSLRNAYIATFMSEEAARRFVRECGLDETAAGYLTVARGNHRVIRDFMASCQSPEDKAAGIDLLRRISAKDLRDVSLEVLTDHLRNTPACPDAEHFCQYVRNPRVSNEMITPYKAFFREVLSDSERDAYRRDPRKWVAWVAENIRVEKDCNLGGAPMTPAGVWKARMADAHSRDIFFVSAARSMGIPARIDEVTGKVQLMDNRGGAQDVDFGGVTQASAPTGVLKARYTPVKSLADPKYYTHFTISRLTPAGTLQLLNYEESDIDRGGGATWANLLKKGSVLDAGDYLLVTGTRLANGGVLSQMTFFSVQPGKTTVVDLVMREAKDEVRVIGGFNSESLYRPVDGGGQRSVLATTGRGYYIVGILGTGQEPTNHALLDIAALGKEFDEWGRGILLLFTDEEQYRKFRPQEFPGLPSIITYGIDADGSIRRQMVEGLELPNKTVLPVFIIADTFNRVVFVSQGYTIGLGEQLMKVIHKLF